MELRHYIHDWGHSGARAAWYSGISVGLTAFMPAKQRRKVASWAMHNWCRSTSDALGIERQLINGDILDSVEQCVLVSNHLSTADIIVLGSVLNFDYRWLAKAPLFRVPFTGWHLKAAGHVPVYRGDKRHRNSELNKRIQRVVRDEGASLLFFPEGTRSDNGHLKEFRIGAFMAAVIQELPIVPLVLRGTFDVMQKNAPHTNPNSDKKTSITVLPPLSAKPDGDDKTRAEELRDRVWEAYRAELGDTV